MSAWGVDDEYMLSTWVRSAKPRVMTSQSSVNPPKTGLKTAQNSAKHYRKQVMGAVFALPSLKQYDHIFLNSAIIYS